ncbi:MAG: transposase [Oculatellaceae cyanobacterium bins.114]|nr:transposase [Oculatellaceae cyanobacterium bins.114]
MLSPTLDRTASMPQYRRVYTPGGTVSLTLVTYNRIPIFADSQNIVYLRSALAALRSEMPFEITAAVILPDHLHFLWTLPPDDCNYSKRIGRLKVLFTRSLRGKQALPQNVSLSRRKHRESNVWQRRFWEHTITDETDLANHFDYLHYNPVKHGLAKCPHQWQYSSFHRYVQREVYNRDWGCQCDGKSSELSIFDDVNMGE